MSIEKNTPNFLKHARVPYTTFLNKTIEAIKDPGALGIYVYLAAKPLDWEISEKNLQNRFGKGRDYIRARMAELKLAGLLKSIAIKDNKGRIIRWETMLFSEPQVFEAQDPETQITENPSSGENVQITENPHSGKPRRVENAPTTNKGSKQIKDLNKPPLPPRGNESRFEEFWTLYPKKKARSVCELKWKQKGLNAIADQIIVKLKKQVELDDEWQRGYAPNPATYLNQSRWEDEITMPKHKPQAKHPHYDDNDTSWISEVSL